MPLKIPPDEKRTLEQIREHFELEKRLANKLRYSGKEERRHLYSALYDELYRQIPHHPRMTQKMDPETQRQRVSDQLRLIMHAMRARKGLALDRTCTFLEIGPGDCSLSFKVADFAKAVYAIDVSELATRGSKYPDNFHLIISDGSSISVPKDSINIAYSNQLMEHLHPDDALEQLQNIFEVLAPEGMYICVTPNRLYGPSDISKYFDEVATGFHLREYTNTELTDLFKQVGFSKVNRLFRLKGNYMFIPMWSFRWLEILLGILPLTLSKKLSRWSPVSKLLFIRMVAIK
jgi:SAM-dependent methyltransferase